MPDFQQLTVLGRLTRDPALKFLPSQMAVCEFGVAVGRKWKGSDGEKKESTMFIDATCFGKGGELINQYCKKGNAIFLCGRLDFQTWEDRTTNQKRSKHVFVVENFQFIGGRDGPGRSVDADSNDQFPDDAR